MYTANYCQMIRQYNHIITDTYLLDRAQLTHHYRSKLYIYTDCARGAIIWVYIFTYIFYFWKCYCKLIVYIVLVLAM